MDTKGFFRSQDISRTPLLKTIYGLFVLGLLPALSQAALSVSPSGPAGLVSALLGPGVTVSGVTYSGASCASGTFTGGTGIIGFPSGIILSSGCASDVVGPNSVDDMTTGHGLPGDPDLDVQAGTTTFDAAILEFDFVPATNSITFEYVFSSDEYNEWIGVNDVFIFFVNGVNAALIPSTSTAVGISTVNLSANSIYYRDNDIASGASLNTEMDGLTVVMTVTVAVNPGVSNHIKIAIGDAGDGVIDSNVFIRSGSFSAFSPTFTLSFTPSHSGTMTPSATLSPTPTWTPTPGPRLVLTKTSDKGYASAGEEVRFTLRYQNVGTLDAVSVQLWDSPPAAMGIASFGGGTWIPPDLVQWSPGTLPPGAFGTMELVLVMPADLVSPVTLLNTAWVDWVNPGNGEAGSAGAQCAVLALLEEDFELSRNALRPSLGQILDIRLSTQRSGEIRIAVFNSAGELVLPLFLEKGASPAVRMAVWDGKNASGEPVASGVYLIRVETPGFAQTRRVIVLR